LPALATAKRKGTRLGGVSSLWAFTESKDAAQREARVAELASLRGRGFTILEWTDLREVADEWLADAEGRLWRVPRGEPLDGWQPSDNVAVALGRGFVVRGGTVGRSNEPRTLAELEERLRVREAEQAQAERKAQAAFDARRKSAQPVSASTLDGGQALTLAQAAAAVEASAGHLALTKDARLVVFVPPGPWSGDARHAAAVLYAGEEHVVAALQAKRAIPDRQVSPAGALL
jgi:hypothetical protein